MFARPFLYGVHRPRPTLPRPIPRIKTPARHTHHKTQTSARDTKHNTRDATRRATEIDTQSDRGAQVGIQRKDTLACTRSCARVRTLYSTKLVQLNRSARLHTLFCGGFLSAPPVAAPLVAESRRLQRRLRCALSTSSSHLLLVRDRGVLETLLLCLSPCSKRAEYNMAVVCRAQHVESITYVEHTQRA